MTAEETLIEQLGEHDFETFSQILTPNMMTELYQAMKTYAKQKYKEQRELCANEIWNEGAKIRTKGDTQPESQMHPNQTLINPATKKQLSMEEEKKIEDYLPYYIGAKVISSEGTMDYTLCGIWQKPDGSILPMFRDRYGNEIDLQGDWKICIRPLSSVSKIEIDEYIKASSFTQSDLINRAISDAEGIKYLFSKHFDLFGLHEAGLCLYETDLNAATK